MKVYAIVECYIDKYSLTLISDPSLYKNKEIVYSELEYELPTIFYSTNDLLSYWEPYSGTFEIDILGTLDNDGYIKEDPDSSDIYTKRFVYESGKLINTEYEEV